MYTIEVKNRYSSLISNSHGELDDQTKYNILSDTCSDIGKKLLPKTPKRKWSNLNKTHNVIEARKSLKHALESGSKADIDNATADLACAYKDSQDTYISTLTHIIEDASYSGRHALAWKVVNEITGRKTIPRPGRPSGSIEERKKKWKDHFRNLLCKSPIVPDDDFKISPIVSQDLPIDVTLFKRTELEIAIKQSRRGGAVGIDVIHLEIWESKDFFEDLLNLCNKGLTEHIKPSQWSKSAIKPIPKKGSTIVTNHRGISLNCIAAKLYNKMLLNRIQPHVDPILSWTQCGFRKSRSTLSNIRALRRIIEGLKDKNVPLALVFIDFSKAFDSIHRDRMFQILRAYGIPSTIVDAIKLIYENSSAQIITPDGETDFFI